MKRGRSTAVVVKRWAWSYVYAITNDAGRVIYIGKTTNEARRAAAHQRTATNQCRRLARSIDTLRETSSTWQFAKNYHRVPGLPHGLPEEEADRYEAFFIARIGGHGTLHSEQHNPLGCNMREGNGVAQHEASFDDIQARLDALGSDGALFTEHDRLRRARKVLLTSNELIVAGGDVDIVASVRDACADDTGRVPACVEETYQVVVRHCEALTNVDDTQRSVKALKTKYHDPRTATDYVDRAEFAKEWNALGSLLNNYLPDDANERQQTAHRRVCYIHKHEKVNLQNGEDLATTRALTKGVVSDAVDGIHQYLKARDDAGGVPRQSFQSMMAWCLPGSKLHGTPQDRLKRIDVLIANPALSEQQLDLATARRVEIKREVAAAAAAVTDGAQPAEPSTPR